MLLSNNASVAFNEFIDHHFCVVFAGGFIGAAAEIGVLRVCIQEGYVDCRIVERVLK